jgi:zinc transporter, ZIP family
VEENIIWLGFVASLLAGACSGIGGLAVFVVRRISDRTEDVLLSVAAGIMLAASFFSLILPGIEYAEEQVGIRSAAVAIVVAGIMVGAWALYIVHRCLPHEHFVAGREGPDTAKLRRIWLFVLAITLHNFPEGMAVGVGFAGGNIGNGIALATGIGLQNIPEGLAVAVSMRAIDYSRLQSFSFAFLTGLVEPVGGVFGAAAVSLAEPMMPWTLGFAAGAMLFIISDEIIPETHRGGYQSLATFSLLGGFGLMMFLDATLG